MSRSYRKSPYCGVTTARSEKDDKRIGNRKFRRKAKVPSHKFDDLLEEVLEGEPSTTYDSKPIPHMDTIMNQWSMAKDGRQYIPPTSKWYRKLMRK